jgi:hypothetical protein
MLTSTKIMIAGCYSVCVMRGQRIMECSSIVSIMLHILAKTIKLGGVGAKSIYSLNSNIILVKGKKERERK